MFFLKTNDRCLIYGFWEIHCFSTVFGKISILKLNTIQGSVDVMSPLLQILPLFICLSLCHVGYFKYIVGLLYSVFFIYRLQITTVQSSTLLNIFVVFFKGCNKFIFIYFPFFHFTEYIHNTYKIVNLKLQN